jgi:glucosamine-6-phosphate deaminase
MSREYRDKKGNHMTKEEVQLLPIEKLSDRSDVSINILPDYDTLYDAVADVMVATVKEKKGEKVTMILPVGPMEQYPRFAKKVKENNIDCRNLWTFNMDEFIGRNGRTVPESHPMSFKAEMAENFYDLIHPDLRMPLEQMYFPRHDNMDQIDEAFDKHAEDGVDLCLAGVGPEGHFAFNEDPNYGHIEVTEEEFLADRTRLVIVKSSTVDMDALAAGCGDRSAVPPFAVTIGPHDVLRAKRTEVIFFAGKFNRTALREVLFRTPTMRFPGSLLKLGIKPDGTVKKQNLTVWATPEEAGPVTSRTIA